MFNRSIAAGDSSEARFALAMSYFNLGSYDAAIANCHHAIENAEDFAPAYLLMGRTYAKLSKTPQAISALRRAVALNPGCEQCSFHLALSLLEDGEETDAIALFRKVIRINPQNASAHYQLGKELAKQKKNSEATHELESAIALEPKFDRAYYQLGRIYLETGDKKRRSATSTGRRS